MTAGRKRIPRQTGIYHISAHRVGLIHHHEESLKGVDGGTTYHSSWELANLDGPAPQPGVTRVTINEGSWLLESIGSQTRATYTLYTDGGGIPPLIMNYANKQSVTRLFDALHTRMHDGK